MSNETTVDNDFLNINVNDIPDAPPIAVPPSGIYDMNVKVLAKVVVSKKDGETYKFIEFRYTINAEVERFGNTDERVIPGQMFSTSTTIDPDRLKWHKENIKALMEMSGVQTFEQLLKVPETRVIAKVTRTEKRDTPGEYYANVSDMQAA